MAMPPLVPLGTGARYCSRCYALLPTVPFIDEPLPCIACRALDEGPIDDVLAITYLTWDWPKRIGSDIYYMKKNGEHQHLAGIAEVLHRYLDLHGETIQEAWRPTAATYVATNEKKVQRRGFDHVKEIIESRPDNVARLGIRPMLRQLRETNLPTEGRTVRADDWDLLPKVNVAGGRILLIDDTLTSGTTAASIAQKLREHGAARVYLLVIARAIFDDVRAEVMEELENAPFDWGACKLKSKLTAKTAIATKKATATSSPVVTVKVRTS